MKLNFRGIAHIIGGIFLNFLLQGGCILPVAIAVITHYKHPESETHWPLVIAINICLIGVMLWLLRTRKLSDDEWIKAKNEAQQLKVGDRVEWERDSGIIVEKGNHHVTINWDQGKHYPKRIDRVFPDEKA